MAIDNFHSWFRRRLSKAVIPKKKMTLKEIDVLCVDMNHMVHVVVNRAKRYTDRMQARELVPQESPAASSRSELDRTKQSKASSSKKQVEPEPQQQSYSSISQGINSKEYRENIRRRFERNFRANLVRELEKVLFRTFVVKRMICLSFDGGAPIAKLMKQRDRREKHLFSRMKLEREEKWSSIFDSSEISPGTVFMRNAVETVTRFVRERVRLQKNEDCLWIVDGADVCGEGEIKIMNFLNTAVNKRNTKKSNLGNRNKYTDSVHATSVPAIDPSDLVVIYGADSDLIVQAITLTQLKQLYVYGDNLISVRDAQYAVALDFMQGEFEKEEIMSWDHSRGFLQAVRLDFAALMGFAGNDYFPKLIGCDLDTLWKAYKETRNHFRKERNSRDVRDKSHKGGDARPSNAPVFLMDADGRSFNWTFLTILLDFCKPSSMPTIETLRESNYKGLVTTYRRKIYEERLEAEAIDREIRKQVAKEAAGKSSLGGDDDEEPDSAEDETEYDEDDGVSQIIYEDEVDSDADIEEVNIKAELAKIPVPEELKTEFQKQAAEMVSHYPKDPSKMFSCRNYLTGILWFVQMLLDGVCPDYYFLYPCPFAPSANELAKWIRTFDADPFPDLMVPINTREGLSVFQASAVMLPRENYVLLPDAIQKVLEKVDIEQMLDRGNVYESGVLDLSPLVKAMNRLRYEDLDARDRAFLRKRYARLIRKGRNGSDRCDEENLYYSYAPMRIWVSK